MDGKTEDEDQRRDGESLDGSQLYGTIECAKKAERGYRSQPSTLCSPP
jgi:hypothetical protein